MAPVLIVTEMVEELVIEDSVLVELVTVVEEFVVGGEGGLSVCKVASDDSIDVGSKEEFCGSSDVV